MSADEDRDVTDERDGRSADEPDMAADDYIDLPPQMREARRWMVHKGKVPHYVNGRRRNGVLDSDIDRKQLASLREAVSALRNGGYDGLGFALGADGTGNFWQGIDLDHLDQRPELQLLAEDLPSYTESSPSGRGVHAIGYGNPFAALGANGSGIEAYSAGRFFTVTGECAGLGTLVDLAPYVDVTLRPMHARGRAEGAEAAGHVEEVPDETIAHLRSALAALRADDRSLWVRMGQCLVCLGERGRALWIEWSQTSNKYDPTDAARVWDSFTGERAGYKGVFTEARRQGWVNPGARPEVHFGRESRENAAGIVELTTVSPVTHYANAQRIAAHYRDQLMYVRRIGWFVYPEAGPWRQDDDAALRMAAGIARIVQAEAAELAAKAVQDADRRERWNAQATERMRWAKASESLANASASLALARSLLEQSRGALDADPDLLGTPSGVIDLRTGEFRAHHPEDRITRMTAVDPNLTSSRAVFDQMLARLFPGQAGARISAFLQRWLGYCVTGRTHIALLVVWLGRGANGKSTLAKLLLRLLGDYAAPAAPGLLRAHRGERHPTETASLDGLRLAVIAEWEAGDRLNEGLVKQLTGSDAISTRRMGQDFYAFNPTHKLLLFANHRPLIQGDDDAIWRRIALVPFEQTIAEAERDPDIDEKLWSEAPAVLAWVIAGARSFLADGLELPEDVRAATRSYRAESDAVGRFLAECCDMAAAKEQLAGDLLAAYREWCTEEDEKPLKQRRFGQTLTERGFGTDRAPSGHNIRTGLALNELGRKMRARAMEGTP